MSLAIKKFSYSRAPWRIALNGVEFAQHLSFERKRDAVPFLARLEAIGDWSRFDEFTAEQKAAVVDVICDTDSYRLWASVVTRQATQGAFL